MSQRQAVTTTIATRYRREKTTILDELGFCLANLACTVPAAITG